MIERTLCRANQDRSDFGSDRAVSATACGAKTSPPGAPGAWVPVSTVGICCVGGGGGVWSVHCSPSHQRTVPVLSGYQPAGGFSDMRVPPKGCRCASSYPSDTRAAFAVEPVQHVPRVRGAVACHGYRLTDTHLVTVRHELSSRTGPRSVPHLCSPHDPAQEAPSMDTRMIAILALVIAVVVVLILVL